ncbi:TPA: DUF4435 domain-containing protein [Providencia alcalifaciens]
MRIVDMKHEFKLSLPRHSDSLEEITTNQSILLIGANGSGKTRLGAWLELESSERARIHRISAQKSLSMPDNITPTSIEKAENDLLFGYQDVDKEYSWSYKTNNKWAGKPAISLLNDYQKLMVFLFSDHTEESAKYLAESKLTTEKVAPPITKLDLVKLVWERILPHRELILGGLRIQTRVKGKEEQLYNSSEMSDGERVIFYLIGQCLAAPKGGIIIIDEPEIHLHKSVQIPLWKEIEGLRPDCLFVYMTHDVDFAVAHNDSQKIWLKSYDGNSWDWEKIPNVEGLPESLLIEILGSRKEVVFVEGENESYDLSLYRAILSNHLVIPVGSCSQVIQMVKALKSSQQFHSLNVCGIIDRDRRLDQEIKSLLEHGIYTLEVAEVENLFCVPEIVEIVSQILHRDPNEDSQSVKNFVIRKIQDELENQISMRVANEIKFQLCCFDEKAKGLDGLKNALAKLNNDIDIDKLYVESESLFQQIIGTQNYLLALKFYNRKSLPSQISKQLGLSNKEFANLVVRLAYSSENSENVRNALKPYFGSFFNKYS